jgi:hypothetical protein
MEDQSSTAGTDNSSTEGKSPLALKVEAFFQFSSGGFGQVLFFYIRKRWHLFNNCYKIAFTTMRVPL